MLAETQLLTELPIPYCRSGIQDGSPCFQKLSPSIQGTKTSKSLSLAWASLVAQTLKNPPAMQETWVWSLHWEDPLEEGMAIHSSILTWRIPWTEEPGGLQSMGSQSRTWLSHEAQHRKWRWVTDQAGGCDEGCTSLLDLRLVLLPLYSFWGQLDLHSPSQWAWLMTSC